MKLHSPIAETADGTSINIAHPSSTPPTMVSSSLTICAADIAMPVTSMILSDFPTPKWILIAHQTNLQVIRFKSLGKERVSTCNMFCLPPLVCINLRLLSFVMSDSDIDFLSSHLCNSPPITPIPKVGLVSGRTETETTVACEIPLNLFAMELTLSFIDSNPTVDQVEGLVQGAVDFLEQPSSILTGSCLLQISIFYF